MKALNVLSVIFFGFLEMLKSVKNAVVNFIIDYWFFHPAFATLLTIKPICDALTVAHSPEEIKETMIGLFIFHLFFHGMWEFRKLLIFIKK